MSGNRAPAGDPCNDKPYFANDKAAPSGSLTRTLQVVDSNRAKAEKERLKIAFVSHTAQPGGGELALVELIRHLDRTRVVPIVIVFSSGPLCELLQGLADVHIVSLDSSILNARKDSLGSYRILKPGGIASVVLFVHRLCKLFRQMDLDIVHANSLKTDVLAGIAARLCGLPVLWHVRDQISHDYLPRPAAVVFRLLARILPSFIVANSASTLACLSLRAGVSSGSKAKKAAVVHDGVHLPTLENPAVPSSLPLITVGLVGRISPWKGQDIFLLAAARVLRRFPEARFLIVGASLFGEQAFEHHVRSLCEELDLSGQVEFTGFDTRIRTRIAQMDILVHASTLPEPFGQVIIEAMAAAKPVIATNGGGVPEIVVDGVTGLLVPMRDADRMADAICRLIAAPVLRAEMGVRGRERVHQLFTIEQTAMKVHDIYDAIIMNRQNSDRKDVAGYGASTGPTVLTPSTYLFRSESSVVNPVVGISKQQNQF